MLFSSFLADVTTFTTVAEWWVTTFTTVAEWGVTTFTTVAEWGVMVSYNIHHRRRMISYNFHYTFNSPPFKSSSDDWTPATNRKVQRQWKPQEAWPAKAAGRPCSKLCSWPTYVVVVELQLASGRIVNHANSIWTMPLNNANEHQWALPINNQNEQCQSTIKMNIKNANEQCQSTMSMNNANQQCQWTMPTNNPNEQWLHKPLKAVMMTGKPATNRKVQCPSMKTTRSMTGWGCWQAIVKTVLLAHRWCRASGGIVNNASQRTRTMPLNNANERQWHWTMPMPINNQHEQIKMNNANQ